MWTSQVRRPRGNKSAALSLNPSLWSSGAVVRSTERVCVCVLLSWLEKVTPSVTRGAAETSSEWIQLSKHVTSNNYNSYLEV